MNFGSGSNSLYHFYFKKKKYDQCKCQHQEDEELQIIELKKGRVTFRKDYSANKFRTHDYTRVDFIVKLLFRIISLNGNLFFLVISLIQLCVDSLSPFLTWIHVAPLVFYGCFKALKEMFFDYKKLKFDMGFNRLKTRRLSTKKHEKVEEIYWEDIEVGDIIVMFENDYAPADLILLDTSLTMNKENVAYVSTKVIDGKKNLVTKKCPKITAFGTGKTQSSNFSEYCQNLSGKLEYDNPNTNLDAFHGVISLTKDPKAEILTNHNFVMQLSKLKNIKWAIGIVVYAGRHTKITMNSDWHIRKSNFGLVFVNKFNYLMIFFVCLLAMISTVVFLGRSEVIPYLTEYESYVDNSLKFFFFLIQYADFVPLATYFVLDIFELIHYGKIQYSQTKGIRNHFVETYNPITYGNLGMVDYAILDQTVFNLENKLKVKQVYVDKKLYTIRQEELTPKVINLLEKNQSHVEYNSKVDIDVDEPGSNPKIGSVEEKKSVSKVNNVNDKKKVGFKDFPADYSEAQSFKPQEIARIYSRKDEERDPDYLKFGTSFKETMKELDVDPQMNSDYIEQLGVDDFVNDILEKDIDELMKAILICSEAKCVKTAKLNDKVISNFEEEKALLSLAKNLQCTIEAKARVHDTKIKLKIRNNMLDIVLIGTSESQEKTGKLSVVACPLRKNGSAAIDKAYLYVKGPFNEVRPLIGSEDLEKNGFLDIAADKISKNGTVPFLFAKKKLDMEETRNFAKNYKNLKANLTLQESSIDSMFTSLEKDLDVVGMCGIEKQCYAMIQDSLKTLEQTGINRWIVSNDSLEKMLVQLSTYNLFKIDDTNFYVNATTSETVAIQIKRYMSKFQQVYEIRKKLKGQAEIGLKGGKLIETYKELSDEIMNQMKEYTMLVSGKSLDLIVNDPSTYEHFAFLCYLVGKVIGFHFTPDNKKNLVTMIKEKFAKDTYVMCIGTNFSDVSMVNAADIGIMSTNFKKNPFISAPWGDIVISDLTKIKRLLLKSGIRIAHQIDHTLYYLFYKSIAITLPLFFFNWFSTMTGTSIYDSVLLFLLFFLFTTFPVIAFSFEKPFSLSYAMVFPALYSESRFKKTYLLKKFILRSVIEGIIHSTVIFYIGLYHVGRSMSSEGLTSDFVMVSLFFVISLVFVINFKIFFSFTYNKIVFWTGIIWSLTFLFGFIWVNVSASFTETMYSGLNYQLDELVGRLTTLFCFFIVIMSCLAFSYVIHHYIIFKEVSSAWNILSYKFKTGQIEHDLTNDKILNVLDSGLTINRIVKLIYKRTAHLDTFIFEMLAMMGGAVSSIGLNKFTLKFKDRILERRYKNSKMAQSIVLTKAIYYTGTAFFIIWAIIISVNEGSIGFAFSRFIICIVLFGICFFINTKRYLRNYSIWNFIFGAAIVATKLSFDFIRKDDGSLSTALMTMVISTFFSLELIHNITLNICLLVVFYIRQGQNYKDEPDQQSFYILISNYILLSSISTVSVYLGAQLEKQRRIEFMAYMKIDSQSTSYNNVLSLLVPNFVKELLNRGHRFIAEDQGKVAIIFCDICDFDRLVGEKESGIVKILDSLWRQYDKYCQEYGVQKIETVGKTYMACAGLKSSEKIFKSQMEEDNPTKRAVQMAQAMMSFAEECVFDDDCSITVKIGIHYGRTIAGIIGHHKPQFSLIGDSVNIANRCCSTAEDGKIALTEGAYEQVLKENLRFDKRKVENKGRGEMVTQVLRREKHNRNIRKPEGNNQAIDRLKSLMTMSIMETETAKNDIYDVPNLNNLDLDEPPKSQAVSAVISSKKKKEKKREVIPVDYNPEYEEDDVEARTYQLIPSKFLLKIPDHPLKTQFNRERDRKFNTLYYIALFFLAIVYLIQSMLILIVRKAFGFPSGFIALRGSFSGMLIGLILLGKFFERRKILNRIFLYVILLYGAILIAIQSQYTTVKSLWFHRITMLELVVVLIIGINSRKFKFYQSILFYIVYTIIWVAIYAYNPNMDYEYIFYYFIFAFYIAINHYLTEYNEIKRFNIGLKQNQKNFIQDNLISQLLPTHALEKLLRNKRLLNEEATDELKDVTILFADIAGFSKYCASVEPEEVVKMLSELFHEFDQMCVRLKVYKVYTIGDCYVALGFNNKNSDELISGATDADNIIQMGIAMIRIIQVVKEQINHPGLNMRIGVHTGKVIGGIIGTEVVRYDLYGPDVLIANKMEAHGKEGMIQVSEDTRNLLQKAFPEKYRFEKNTDIDIKSLNKTIEGYIVYAQDREVGTNIDEEDKPFKDA